MQVQNISAPIVQSYDQPSKKMQAKPDLSLNARVVSTMFNQSSDNASANALAHSALLSMVDGNQDIKDFLMGLENEGAFSLKDLGYEGKPILELNPKEAGALLQDGGFFSVENTAARASGFVIAGAGDDLSRLKAGREGIVKGFAEAEKLWGGKLPDIAYESQKLALEQIDQRIQSLGGSALDVKG